MSAEALDSGQPSNTLTPVRAAQKSKKRVGFHSSGSSGGAGVGSLAPDNVFDGSAAISPLASPKHPPGYIPPGAPDARELSIALTRILTGEDDRGHPVAQEVTTPLLVEPESPAPRRPRPALRRNTSYDVPLEKEEADKAEKLASQRQLRSITDARQRADRLAVSIHSYSAPGSRRNSDEMNAPFQSAVQDSDDRDDDEQDYAEFEKNPLAAPIPAVNLSTMRRRANTVHRRPEDAIDSPPHPTIYQEAAEHLIQSHTANGFFQHQAHAGSASGTITPDLQAAYVQDYVPRPDKYRGGVLASLLKLYSDGKTNGLSGQSTPAALETPVMTPRGSPTSSRRASFTSGQRPRSSGFFTHHKGNRSTSSLTALMKSSSTFAAPGSSNISDQWGAKLKKDIPKPKKDKRRITIHIAGIISRHRYLMKLCRALMMYGAPTHRLEEYMIMSSRVLEIEGQFLYLPSCMIISFDDSATHTTEVKLVRVPQGIDLGRLRDVHNIYKDVVHDKLGVEEATKRLDEVISRKPKFDVAFRVFMYGIASACVAPFAFEGRFIDLPLAFVLGCIVGILQLVFAPSNELYAHVFEVSAAIITSFIARGFGSIRNGELFCFSALAQSSIALILPGYLVLCSSLELQSQNIVAGSVRMVYAMIYTLFLGYGITIGASLYGIMDSNATSNTHCTDPLHRGWYFLFVPCFTLCLCIVNQAKWKQMPVMTVMALAGFCVNNYSSSYFEGNSQISNMLGALAVGILANLYSRIGRHVENGYLDLIEWYQFKIRPRIFKKKRNTDEWPLPVLGDPESRPGSPEPPQRAPRKVGYSLAAAAMLPAIFVQVPSGLAAGGSLLAGVTSANQITGNTTVSSGADNLGNLDGTTFNVLFSVIQVAIGISVGLFMSALIVYPLGKRRSGLFSF